MKQLVFGFALLAIGFAATTAARADYAVVMFQDGTCRIWNNSKATPVKPGYKYHWVGPQELGFRADEEALRAQASLVQIVRYLVVA